MMEVMEELLHLIINCTILIFEYIGVAVLIFSGVRSLIHHLQRRPDTGVELPKGLAMGLEFLLLGEILRTVIVREMSEILFVGSIIVMRVVLTVLIHWEIKGEETSRAQRSEKE